MTKSDDLFAAAATEDSVFADKRAPDPLADPDGEVRAREYRGRSTNRVGTLNFI